LRVGTAEVSTKHANFFQADPGGSGDDVYALMHEVRQRVATASGTVLHPETRLVGFPPLPEPSGSAPEVPDG
jgi:UDP-N-acetylmuramate dehydrogenase